MTIAGIGVDVVNVRGFDEQLAVGGTTMRDQFTPAERDLRQPSRPEPEHLAVRWAAKEAFVKAWSVAHRGLPPRLPTVDLREIEVVRDAWGRPAVRLHGEVERAVTEAFDECTVHLSLSHDTDVAVAMVVIELTGATT